MAEEFKKPFVNPYVDEASEEARFSTFVSMDEAHERWKKGSWRPQKANFELDPALFDESRTLPSGQKAEEEAREKSIFHLIRLLATQRHFELVNMGKDSGVLEYFLTCYQEDIRKFFPEFQKNVTDFDTAYMVLSDTIPAGVLLGNLKEDGTLDVMLDYATPGYRDCSVGRFLYERLPERGVYRLLLRVRTNDFELYLQKMGFEKEDHHFVREL